jgi:DNA-binding beta-propeller fold protein YncE
MDYIVYERGASRVWAPFAAGNVGAVAVLDVAKGTWKRVDGFKTVEREANGKKRTQGPSAVTIGDGFAYVGDRATSEICPVSLATLAAGKCLKLSASTDGVAYVAGTKEIWVTSPREQTLTILDASKPDAPKTKSAIKLDGAPEGYAVDEARGLFFTNLEDKGKSLAIDVKTHKVTTTSDPGCGSDGPRGLVVDAARKLVVVACTDHLQVLGEGGALLGKLDTGAGVDNIDYLDGKQLVYAGAGKAQKLTVARLDDRGQLTVVATGATAPGARNPVVDASGAAYLTDAANARLVAFPAP